MALITCPECDATVSTGARTCPQCGASRRAMKRARRARNPISTRGKLLVAAVVVGVVVAGGISAQQDHDARSAPATKEQAADQQRVQAGALALSDLKQSLRDPASLSVNTILVNDDGSVVCITYRAQNGFGGMNLEQMVFADGSGTTSAKAWRHHCAHRSLYDVTDVVNLLSHW